MTTYRGTTVDYVEHNQRDDTYSLYNEYGYLIATLKRHEYLSHPQLRTMRLGNGRHRPTPTKDQRGSNRKSRDPWATASNPWLTPGAIYPIPTSFSNAAQGSGLTATKLDLLHQMMKAHASPSQIFAAMEKYDRPALKREGIIAGEIVGYRCWRIDGGTLRSVYQSDAWEPGKVLEGRELGDWDSRGIHAWKNPASKDYHNYIRGYLNQEEDPLRAFYLGGEMNRPKRPAMATGTVFLWGDVVEHERGWRAEFARVRSLDWLYPDETMMGKEQQALDDLRSKYIR